MGKHPVRKLGNTDGAPNVYSSKETTSFPSPLTLVQGEGSGMPATTSCGGLMAALYQVEVIKEGSIAWITASYFPDELIQSQPT